MQWASVQLKLRTELLYWFVLQVGEFARNRAGAKADFPFQIHAHMLRHAAGYKLASDGHDTRSIQDYLGHRNIQHTIRKLLRRDFRISGEVKPKSKSGFDRSDAIKSRRVKIVSGELTGE